MRTRISPRLLVPVAAAAALVLATLAAPADAKVRATSTPAWTPPVYLAGGGAAPPGLPPRRRRGAGHPQPAGRQPQPHRLRQRADRVGQQLLVRRRAGQRRRNAHVPPEPPAATRQRHRWR